MDDNVVIKFEGQLADAHKLPAYSAAQSLAGISRSFMIPAAYLEDGRVRYRNLTDTTAFQLNLLTQRPGSFETVLELLTNPALMGGVLGALGYDVSKDLVKDFIYSIINRCIGGRGSDRFDEMESTGALNSGDMAALVDAIEPAMRDAHKIIGNGASNIYIINGDRNVLNFNSKTKSYVNTSIDDDEIQVRDFSIASFNANTRNGRAFDYEAGHTIAFILDEYADGVTINAVIESMRCYARKRHLGDDLKSRVSLKYSAVYSPERRIKKIKIFEARRTIESISSAN